MIWITVLSALILPFGWELPPLPFGFWVRKFVLRIRIPCGSHDDILLPLSFGVFQHLWQWWIQPLNNISFVLLDTCRQSINPMRDAALLVFLIYLLLLKIRISLCVLIVPVNHHSTDIQECQGNCCQQFLYLYKKGYKMGFNLKVIRLACWLVSLFSFYFFITRKQDLWCMPFLTVISYTIFYLIQ